MKCDGYFLTVMQATNYNTLSVHTQLVSSREVLDNRNIDIFDILRRKHEEETLNIISHYFKRMINVSLIALEVCRKNKQTTDKQTISKRNGLIVQWMYI